MDLNVARWQQQVDHEDEQQELGPVAQLFQATVVAFSAVLKIIADDPGQYDDGLMFYNSLRDEFQKFYIWNEGFPSSSGELDVILSCSKNLRATALDLMVQWARVVCRIPKALPGYTWSGAQQRFTELEVLTEKIGQVAEAVTKDVNAQYAIGSHESDSDSGSDSSSMMSVGNFEDIIEDLKVYIESLMDLTPPLENPAIDFVVTEQSNVTAADDLLNVAEPARPFVLIIKDRFPSTDTGLVKKLGEANWQRRERLAMKLAQNQGMSTILLSDSDSSSADETVVDPMHRQAAGNGSPRASIVRSSISFASNYQSITTASNFSDASIFDRGSAHIATLQHRQSIAESFTSFATSIAEGVDNGQRRLPSLPPNHDFDSPFQCKICGTIRRDISNRADWKRHVYDDLEPYICLFPECTLGLHTFKSQREWMVHEFTVHRTEASWRCNLCAQIFQAQEHHRAHITKTHKLDLVSSQISEILTASKRQEMKDGNNEVCPFCLVIPAQTQKGFAHHVGRHLQEISLAALPANDASLSDDDNSDDDSDSDSDGDGEHNASKKHEEILVDGRQSPVPVFRTSFQWLEQGTDLRPQSTMPFFDLGLPGVNSNPASADEHPEERHQTSVDPDLPRSSEVDHDPGLRTFETGEPLVEHYVTMNAYLKASLSDPKESVRSSKARGKLQRLTYVQFMPLLLQLNDEK